MKEELCRAFCDDLSVRTLPGGGLAVSTTFMGPDKDRIGFYVIKNAATGLYCIEDDGRTLPMLEASGVDFRSGTRGEALQELLEEYGVHLDDDSQEFRLEGLAEKQIPAGAMKFVAFSLRVRDFLLMTEFRVASTFRDDAAKMLREVIGERAVIGESEAISPALADFPADFVIRAPDRPPVGVFLGTSDGRVWNALWIQMRALYEVREPTSIVLLMERSRFTSAKVRQQAQNRLAAVVEFRGDEVAAIERIAREATGQSTMIH